MIRIWVQGFQWNQATIINDFFKVSFLNKTELPTPITNRIDVFPSIHEIDELNYSGEDVEQDVRGYYKTMYSSNFSFRISPFKKLSNGQRADDFFLIQGNTNYIKYKVEVEVDGVTLFVGSVNQDGISQTYDTSELSEMISVEALGFDAEAKQYYGNLPLPNFTDIPGSGQTSYKVIFEGENDNLSQSIKTNFLSTFITGLFESNFFVNPTEFTAWRIMERPHFYKVNVTGSNLQWYKSGYRSAQRRGENRFDYFNRLMNAMGWVYYFWTRNNVPAIYVKNRFETGGSVFTLDASNIIGYEIKKSSPFLRPYAVAMFDGREFGGDAGLSNSAMRGDRTYVIGHNRQEALNSSGISDVVESGGKYVSPTYQNYGTVRVNDDTMFQYSIDSAPGGNVISTHTINKTDLLVIDNGSHVNFGMQVDWVNTKNFDSDENINNTSFVFTGHYGNHIFASTSVIHPSPDLFNVSYRDYIKQNTFKNNFLALLRGSSNHVVTVTVKGLITTPMTTLQFNNGQFVGKRFSIKEMSLDIYRRQTNLTLYSI